LAVAVVALVIQVIDQAMLLLAEVVEVEHGTLLGNPQVQQELNLNNIAFRDNMVTEIPVLRALEK
jgi:hypothetical protein